MYMCVYIFKEYKLIANTAYYCDCTLGLSPGKGGNVTIQSYWAIIDNNFPNSKKVTSEEEKIESITADIDYVLMKLLHSYICVHDAARSNWDGGFVDFVTKCHKLSQMSQIWCGAPGNAVNCSKTHVCTTEKNSPKKSNERHEICLLTTTYWKTKTFVYNEPLIEKVHYNKGSVHVYFDFRAPQKICRNHRENYPKSLKSKSACAP